MKKVGLLILALVLALGALGAGYAYWTQNLYVNTTVNTGELEAIIENVDVPEDINGAHVTYELNSAEDTLTITANGIYPGYTGIVHFNIKNTGTIPIYITPEISQNAPWSNPWFYTVYIGDDAETYYPNWPYVGDNTPTGRTSVIEPGESLPGKVVIAMDPTETGHENETFSWNVTFVAHQANQP